MAETPEERQRRRRRGRLIRGLLVGGAALGLPALINALVARRAKRLPAAGWGDTQRYQWSGGEIVFHRLGDSGPAVMLIHSLGPGHSAHQWRRIAESLSDEYTVFVPDLVGWGDSGRPQINYDDDFYIELLLDFVADVVQRRVSLVAAGLPAAYAIQVAVDHPEQIESLGLVVPLGLGLHGDEPDLKDAVVHRLLRLPVLGTSALNLFTSRAGIGHHLRREVFHDPELVTDELIERHYRASHLDGAQASLAAYVAGYLNHDVSRTVSRVDLPVWIGWGREARSPAVESADLWLRELPNAELEVIGGAGAAPHVEDPDSFSRSLSDFLARHVRS